MKKYDRANIVVLIFSGIITISALSLAVLIVDNPDGYFLSIPVLIALIGSATSIILNILWKMDISKSIVAYIISYILSVILAICSWISFNDKLMVATPIILFVISTLLIIMTNNNIKSRIILILANPMLYYSIFMIFIMVEFSKHSWNGWNLEP